MYDKFKEGNGTLKVYKARRTPDGPWVQVGDGDLKPIEEPNRLPISPADAFEWGGVSPGTERLALAILADFLDDHHAAYIFHHDFRKDVITHLPEIGFTLTGFEIKHWLQERWRG